MKNRILFLSIAAFALLLGCEEEPPFINYDPPKTTLDTTWVKPTPSAPQVKQVLLEDVTGVQCVNCPDAAAIAKALQTANPGRVNVIGIHPLNLLPTFTNPINKEGHQSRQDFRTQAGADFCTNILGVPNSLPKGAIDRVKFPDKTDLLMDRTDWTAKTNAQLNEPTPVNITLTHIKEVEGYPIPENELLLEVTVEYTQVPTDTNKNYLTLVLIEDSIVDVQEYIDYSGPIPAPAFNDNYMHMHIMRACLTNATGDLLNKADAPIVAGRVYKKRYKYTFTNPVWVKKQLHVIGYVHRNDTRKDVYQSNHVELDY
ncbi:MAG: Omp28-related outer membrane protein [Bacteroidia bacterium]|jgi:hypothetical protein|nr:Omp28-related outer membrane protein [Bacteroidia bacterium]